jgi:hydroxymethylpyrimidine/phosphomethylpyrimidine kinase
MTMRIALTIAGSDSGGGAGIQADLKTFHQFGVYGTSVITAITAQNTLGVHAVHDIPAALVTAQLDAIASDLPPAAVKTGMLSSAPLAALVAEAWRANAWPNYVLDPVMVATSGDRLLSAEAEGIARKWLAFRYRLIPYLEQVIRAATQTGLPVMRAMPLAFPGNALTRRYETQFMCGDALLVAPILAAGGEVEIALPPGGWYDLNTRKRFAGRQVLKYTAPLDQFPVQLVLDDDTAENATGVLGAGAKQFLWFNRFASPGQFRLEQVWVLFPPGANMTVGADIQLVVYHDPDGNPANGANLLATFDETIGAG